MWASSPLAERPLSPFCTEGAFQLCGPLAGNISEQEMAMHARPWD